MNSRIRVGLLALAAACGHPDPGHQAPGQPLPGPPSPPAVERDFGTIPHGEARSVDFPLDVHSLPGAYYPLRAQLDCSCGHAVLLVRDAGGQERTLDGRPAAENVCRPGEALIARVTIDTRTKDPVDLPAATSRGYVVLQPTDDATGLRRVSWPLLIRFAIECPVDVRPPAIDFGFVPQCARPDLRVALAGDSAHAQVTFGQPVSTDPAIAAALEHTDAGTALRVRCTPGEPGNAQAVLTIPTDLPGGYEVHIGVKWKVVPALQATPMDKLSFQAVLDRAQTPAEARSQYLQVTNHDERQSAEFAVHAIVDDRGNDASSHFAVAFEPVPNYPRSRRMFVRYQGGLGAGFRGRIELEVAGEAAAGGGSLLPITLVVFPQKP